MRYVDNAEKTNQALYALNPDISSLIIPLGHPDSLLMVKEATDSGSIVAILADRVFSDEKYVECDFLGFPCRFPSGPAVLASVLKVPVVLFYGLYEKDRHYRVIFELLTERLTLDREFRNEQATDWMQKYANRLEYHCNSYNHLCFIVSYAKYRVLTLRKA